MQIQELLTYIKSLVKYAYYPYAFPTTAADDVAMVAILQGLPTDEETGISYPAFQILVRGKERDFANTEAKAYEIFNALSNKRNQAIGDRDVVIIRPQSSTPIFIGMDESERPIFSLNFNTVVRP
jgi:hypothetical protein